MTDKAPAPKQGGGGGGGKKRRRKRGGGGPSLAWGNGNAKGVGGGPAPSPSVSATGKGGNSSSKGGGGGGKKHRGGGGGGAGGGGGRGGGGGESSRFGRGASSPLQLPHVKVTLRNIHDPAKHGTMEGVVDSVRSFLESAFPLVSPPDDQLDLYVMAWQMEKEDFETSKNMFAEVAQTTSCGVGGSGDGAVASSTDAFSSSSVRLFSSGWIYEEKPFPLPSGRFGRLALLPGTKSVVADLMENRTDKRVTKGTNINWIVDTAMSQMMQECGKKYLNFVGGRVELDEESVGDILLAERVEAVKEKLVAVQGEKKKEQEDINTNISGNGFPLDQSVSATAHRKDDATSVEVVTKGVEKLSTSDKSTSSKQQPLSLSSKNQTFPAIRMRVLSIVPVKRSKRRGDIGATVQIALYPPDPCELFKDACREAGRLAAEIHVERVNTALMEEAKRRKLDMEKKQHMENSKKMDPLLSGGGNVVKKVCVGQGDDVSLLREGKEGGRRKKDDQTTVAKQDNLKAMSLPVKKATMPQIPYYPLLSPAERSRAVARGRVLLQRTVEAMRLHAAAQFKLPLGSREIHESWEVLESPSQKTWKARSHPMANFMIGSTDLCHMVAEQENAKAGDTGAAAAKKGRGRGGFYGDSRVDRYDSTVENSEDYKLFLKSLADGGSATSGKEDAKENMVNKRDKLVDDEGRPLSAIVQHLLAKQQEERKAKAEAAAAAVKARTAAATAKEKLRKEKLRAKKKELSRKRRKEATVAAATRSKQKQPSSSGSGVSGTARAASSLKVHGGGQGSNNRGGTPPPSVVPPSVLLKKVIPPSGFG